MSDVHIQFIRRTLETMIRRSSRTGASHESSMVRDSVRRRIMLATQALAMLECCTIDRVKFANLLKGERSD